MGLADRPAPTHNMPITTDLAGAPITDASTQAVEPIATSECFKESPNSARQIVSWLGRLGPCWIEHKWSQSRHVMADRDRAYLILILILT